MAAKRRRPDGNPARFATLTIPANAIRTNSPDARRFRAALQDVLAKLGGSARLLVAVHRQVLDQVASWTRDRAPSATLVPIDDEVDFSFWCQDSFMATRPPDSAALIFLLSNVPKTRGDEVVIREVAAAAAIPVHRADTRFEAGNWLVGDTFVLAGADAPALAASDSSAPDQGSLLRDPEGGLAALAAGLHVVYLGTSAAIPARSVRLNAAGGALWVEEVHAGAGRMQPLFHVDMFVSLAGRAQDGRFRVLVGDTRLATELIGDARLPLGAHFLTDELDQAADRLRSDGEFEVIRNPLPVVYSEHGGLFRWSRASLEREFADVPGLDEVVWEMEKRSVRSIGVRRWYFATQNNVLAWANSGGRKTVLLPTYAHGGWRALAPAERRNAEIWAALGFDVVELGDFNVFAQRHGSVRCMVKMFA